MTMDEYNWKGWRLHENPFGKEFDLRARKRMVEGSKLLLPFVLKYKNKIKKSILEIGPFFNPLITPKTFLKKDIFYLDNDIFVLDFLEKEFGRNTKIINCDIDRISANFSKKKFDVIVISHVLNYVDYINLFKVLKKWIKSGGYIFVNNVVNYGIPELFSNKRPKNNNEIIENVKKLGFEIIELKETPTKNKRIQKNSRLILVLKK